MTVRPPHMAGYDLGRDPSTKQKGKPPGEAITCQSSLRVASRGSDLDQPAGLGLDVVDGEVEVDPSGTVYDLYVQEGLAVRRLETPELGMLRPRLAHSPTKSTAQNRVISCAASAGASRMQSIQFIARRYRRAGTLSRPLDRVASLRPLGARIPALSADPPSTESVDLDLDGVPPGRAVRYHVGELAGLGVARLVGGADLYLVRALLG